MAKTQTEVHEILAPSTFAGQFGDLQFHLLQQHNNGSIAKIERISSNSTEVSAIRLNASGVVQLAPKKDSITIVAKPIHPESIGPFSRREEAQLGICSASLETPLWTAGRADTQLTCLSVRRSLLAKHAYGIVNTTGLENLQFVTLDQQRSTIMKKKIDELLRKTDSSRVLDIRLTHLLLSISEVGAAPSPQSIDESLWHCLRTTPAQELSANFLMDQCNISNTKLNNLFKRTLGLSARQFIRHYRLNHVRQALNDKIPFTVCVERFGYSSPDQLYRAYQNLFSEDPPLNVH